MAACRPMPSAMTTPSALDSKKTGASELTYPDGGSTYTSIKELGPKIPYHRRNYGSHSLNSCICGPSGIASMLIYTKTPEKHVEV